MPKYLKLIMKYHQNIDQKNFLHGQTLFQFLNFIYLLLFSFLQFQNLLEIHRSNSIHVCSGNQRNGPAVTTGQSQRLDSDPSTRHLANICISSSKGSDIISSTCIATHMCTYAHVDIYTYINIYHTRVHMLKYTYTHISITCVHICSSRHIHRHIH